MPPDFQSEAHSCANPPTLVGGSLVIADWVNIPENILLEKFESGTGLTCRKTKYLSCDIQGLIDIKNYLFENEHKILIDRIQER